MTMCMKRFVTLFAFTAALSLVSGSPETPKCQQKKAERPPVKPGSNLKHGPVPSKIPGPPSKDLRHPTGSGKNAGSNPVPSELIPNGLPPDLLRSIYINLGIVPPPKKPSAAQSRPGCNATPITELGDKDEQVPIKSPRKALQEQAAQNKDDPTLVVDAKTGAADGTPSDALPKPLGEKPSNAQARLGCDEDPLCLPDGERFFNTVTKLTADLPILQDDLLKSPGFLDRKWIGDVIQQGYTLLVHRAENPGEVIGFDDQYIGAPDAGTCIVSVRVKVDGKDAQLVYWYSSEMLMVRCLQRGADRIALAWTKASGPSDISPASQMRKPYKNTNLYAKKLLSGVSCNSKRGDPSSVPSSAACPPPEPKTRDEPHDVTSTTTEHDDPPSAPSSRPRTSSGSSSIDDGLRRMAATIYSHPSLPEIGDLDLSLSWHKEIPGVLKQLVEECKIPSGWNVVMGSFSFKLGEDGVLTDVPSVVISHGESVLLLGLCSGQILGFIKRGPEAGKMLRVRSSVHDKLLSRVEDIRTHLLIVDIETLKSELSWFNELPKVLEELVKTRKIPRGWDVVMGIFWDPMDSASVGVPSIVVKLNGREEVVHVGIHDGLIVGLIDFGNEKPTVFGTKPKTRDEPHDTASTIPKHDGPSLVPPPKSRPLPDPNFFKDLEHYPRVLYEEALAIYNNGEFSGISIVNRQLKWCNELPTVFKKLIEEREVPDGWEITKGFFSRRDGTGAPTNTSGIAIEHDEIVLFLCLSEDGHIEGCIEDRLRRFSNFSLDPEAHKQLRKMVSDICKHCYFPKKVRLLKKKFGWSGKLGDVIKEFAIKGTCPFGWTILLSCFALEPGQAIIRRMMVLHEDKVAFLHIQDGVLNLLASKKAQ